jgi:hypothetical protein
MAPAVAAMSCGRTCRQRRSCSAPNRAAPETGCLPQPSRGANRVVCITLSMGSEETAATLGALPSIGSWRTRDGTPPTRPRAAGGRTWRPARAEAWWRDEDNASRRRAARQPSLLAKAAKPAAKAAETTATAKQVATARSAALRSLIRRRSAAPAKPSRSPRP